MNCTYEQWSELACSGACDNAYGLIQCMSWWRVLLFTAMVGIVLFILILPFMKKTKRVVP